MPRSLSTSEAARILGMDESRLRRLVRLGLGTPARRGRRYAFSFQDLVILRTADELIRRSVPSARVARALAALAEALPPERPLSGLRIHADGREVAVREGPHRWNPETGQTLFDFELDELAEQVEKVPERPLTAGEAPAEVEALRFFEQALALEDADPVAACTAYARALELDPELADAYVNLGCLAHEAGRAGDAVALYRQALERSPGDPVIHFDLALALEDTGDPATAARHYERAVALDPGFADAHYNLGELCQQLGRPRDALRHLGEYKRLTQPDREGDG